MKDSITDVVSTREAAKRLGVSVRTVQLWVEGGTLRAWKTAGNHRRIYISSLEELIRQRTGGDPCILIVEDEETIRAYYKTLFDLIQFPVRLEFADNGFQGLVKIGELKPELMFVDVDLPGMDGLQMIRAMQQPGSAELVNIVIVSGLSDDQIESRGGIPAGIERFEKPMGIEDFRRVISRYFPDAMGQTASPVVVDED